MKRRVLERKIRKEKCLAERSLRELEMTKSHVIMVLSGLRDVEN